MNEHTGIKQVTHESFGDTNSADGKMGIKRVGQVYRGMFDWDKWLVGGDASKTRQGRDKHTPTFPQISHQDIVFTLDIEKLMRNHVWERNVSRKDAASLVKSEVDEDYYGEYRHGYASTPHERTWMMDHPPVAVKITNAGKQKDRSFLENWEAELPKVHNMEPRMWQKAPWSLPSGRTVGKDWTKQAIEIGDVEIDVGLLYYGPLTSILTRDEGDGVPGNRGFYPYIILPPNLVYQLWKEGYKSLYVAVPMGDAIKVFEEMMENPKQIFVAPLTKNDFFIPTPSSYWNLPPMSFLNFPFDRNIFNTIVVK